MRCIQMLRLAPVAMAVLILAGCTTTAAKKAMNKPAVSDAYTAFDAGASDSSKRKAEKVEPIKDDIEPEEAI